MPQFPQLIPGLSALSGQHDPSSNVISFIPYPAFCTYQQYIALHYHYIGTYYYINITSIKSRSLSIIFTFSKHQIGKSGYLLSGTWERNIQLLLKLQFIQSQNFNYLIMSEHCLGEFPNVSCSNTLYPIN